MTDQIERIRNFVGHEDNLHMWGQLNISRTGRTAGGWLLSSWSEPGAPYWNSKLHWFDRGDEKLYHAYLDLDRPSVELRGEDTEIDAKRAEFIRKMLEKWELEWLQDKGK
jgi:hypothetical protein